MTMRLEVDHGKIDMGGFEFVFVFVLGAVSSI